jgi:hypothetical protein
MEVVEEWELEKPERLLRPVLCFELRVLDD